MASLVQGAHQLLYAANDTAAASISPKPEPVSVTPDFSFLQPKYIFFCLLLLPIFARFFGLGKQKLPAGVKPLPRLPGEFRSIHLRSMVADLFTRPAICRSFLGRARSWH